MSYFNEIKQKYNDARNSKDYKEVVFMIKQLIESACEEGKGYLFISQPPEIVNKMMEDPEFEGFKFKDSKYEAKKPGCITKIISWDNQ